MKYTYGRMVCHLSRMLYIYIIWIFLHVFSYFWLISIFGWFYWLNMYVCHLNIDRIFFIRGFHENPTNANDCRIL